MTDIVINGYAFTPVNENTKRGKDMLTNYSWATDNDIYDAYKTPSKDKVNSFYKLKDKMKELDGRKMRITGAGSNFYSCGYLIDIEDNTYLIYETHCNSFIIKYYNDL